MPSELYLHFKKIQKFCDGTPDIDLADMSGDNFVYGYFLWPDFRSLKNPPILENQLDSIGYNIDLTDSELTGPILGPALGDEDFLVQKLDLEHKRIAEEPFENIPIGLYEHKFFDGRRQSYDTIMRAGEGMQIPTWTHKGFDVPVDNEDIASLDHQEVRKALRDYDMAYHTNYLNSAFQPEATSDPPPKPSAMTNWYRKGPIGCGPKPPPKVRQDAADRIAEDYRLFLQEVTPAKNNWEVEMSGANTSNELGTDDTEDTLVRRTANDAPGSSECITGAGIGVVSTNAPDAAGSNTPGPLGYNFGVGGRRGKVSLVGPARYSFGSIRRDTVGPQCISAGIHPTSTLKPSGEVQSQCFTHQNTFTSEASGECILQTPSVALDYSIKNLATPKYLIKKGSGDSDDGEWLSEKKQKATKRSTTRKTAINKTTTLGEAARKSDTPMGEKANEFTSSSASTSNLIKRAATLKAKNPKTAGRRNAVPKNAAAVSGSPKFGTFHTSKAKPPAAATISNPNLIPKYPTPRKSASRESADGSWEPDDDDMHGA
ncbi:3ac078d0-4bff-499e-9289-88e294f5cf97 [Sclerotinia trifoliorum]|uniref:3ac078d0-4bff-499e-9289-88e294f5cf97 n=1 Tax=Sclerotinia trifoliorum TaxID=28548 RepID=A0A8H2VWZ6_9HELO|nr:3ac078d0-4bff-499e-9289-88e294f5cf97 [Sclerotinia trifoliorum]